MFVAGSLAGRDPRAWHLAGEIGRERHTRLDSRGPARTGTGRQVSGLRAACRDPVAPHAAHAPAHRRELGPKRRAGRPALSSPRRLLVVGPGKGNCGNEAFTRPRVLSAAPLGTASANLARRRSRFSDYGGGSN